MKEDENNFLDPADNPFIKTMDSEPDPKTEDRSDLDYRVPMIFEELTPADLSKQLTDRYPGRDEIEIDGGMTLVRMADGASFTIKATGTPLADVPLATLLKIRDHLR